MTPQDFGADADLAGATTPEPSRSTCVRSACVLYAQHAQAHAQLKFGSSATCLRILFEIAKPLMLSARSTANVAHTRRLSMAAVINLRLLLSLWDVPQSETLDTRRLWSFTLAD